MKTKSPFFTFIFLGLLLTIFLSACNSQNQTASPEASPENSTAAEPEATPFPQPEDGKTSVAGRILSTETGDPIPNILVRLARVVRDGDRAAFVLEDAFSPGGMTDTNGYFIVPNVDAIEYVLVVGDVYGEYQIIEGEDGRAKPWATTVGEVLNVGDLAVDLSIP
ncbi:MAG: carboxypeptidase-like regulatory domain-containing protein [Anaerolineales bacterium]